MERSRTTQEVAEAVSEDAGVGSALRLWATQRLAGLNTAMTDAMLLGVLGASLEHFSTTPIEVEKDEHETHPGAA